MKRLMFALAIGATGFAFADGEEQTVGSLLTVDASQQSELTSEQKNDLNDNKYEAVVVTGSGTVTFSGIGSFDGSITVKSGVLLKCTDKTGVGTAAGKTIVESGGTFAYYESNKVLLTGETFDIAGDGVGTLDGVDYGALFFTVPNKDYTDSSGVFGTVALTAPAKVTTTLSPHGSGRGKLSDTFNQGGFKLTVKANELTINPNTWTDAAEIETQAGFFHWGTKWKDVYRDGCRLVYTGGQLQSYSYTVLTWPVVFKVDSSYTYVSGTTGDTCNNFTGPITIEDGKTLEIRVSGAPANPAYRFDGGFNGNGTVKIVGDLAVSIGGENGSVGGSMLIRNCSASVVRILGKVTDQARITNEGTGSIRLENGANDFTGKTTITKGCVVPTVEGAFPVANTASSDTLAITDGALVLKPKFEGEADGLEGETIRTMIANAASSGIANVQLYVPAGKSYEYAGDLDGSVATFNTYFRADGTLTFTGLLKNDYQIRSNGGTGEMVFTKGFGGSASAKSPFDKVDSGSVRFDGATYLQDAAGIGLDMNLVSSQYGSARFVLEGKSQFVSTNKTSPTTSQRSKLFVPGAADGRAVVEIRGDAVVSNNFLVANKARSVGAVYLRGGTFCHVTGSDIQWGSDAGAQAYFEQTGGLFSLGYWTRGARKPNSAFCCYQSGGTFELYSNGNFIPVTVGTGVVYQTGGTFDGNLKTFVPGDVRWAADGDGGYLNLSLSGSSTRFGRIWSFLLGARNGASHYVNVNDGAVLEAQCLVRSATNVNSRAVVGFDGGVFRPLGDTLRIFGSPDDTDVWASPVVKLYGRGLTVDTSASSSKAFTIDTALEAPTGNGVAAIALPEAFPGGYIAAPVVSIDGDGEGATAVAEFDSASGTVTGITVTSPGWGYTRASATLSRGGPTGGTDVVAYGTVTLAPNVSGGLTKAGAGSLTLNAANTFTGTTAVAGGTLKIGTAAAIASSKSVSVAAGATLDLNNTGDLAVETLCGCYGTIAHGDVTVSKELHFTAADLVAGKVENVTAKLTLGPDVRIVIDDVADLPHGRYTLIKADTLVVNGLPDLPEGLSDPWKLRVKGDSLVLNYTRGFFVIAR